MGPPAPLTIIAGPCVIESERLCEEVCGTLRQACHAAGLQYIFKASYDKANRTSIAGHRGPGLAKGLKILAHIKSHFKVPVLSDVHSPEQAKEAASVIDILQIPALLSRQTDLLLAAGKTGRAVNIKKGPFMAAEDMRYAIEKVERTGNRRILVTERGTTFGYHNLVADLRNLPRLKALGYPVVFDASHSAQYPSAHHGRSGGSREDVSTLARAAVAVGVDALFLEVHPTPARALSDRDTQLNFPAARSLIMSIKALSSTLRSLQLC